MLAYHINVGFPLLDEDSELISSVIKMEPITDDREAAFSNYTRYGPPRENWEPTVLVHEVRASTDGWARTAFVNRRLGFGLSIKQHPEELSHLWQWKQLGYGAYVAGVEPANCFGRGRADDRTRGTLQFLEPGARRTHSVEIGVLESLPAIAAFAASVAEV